MIFFRKSAPTFRDHARPGRSAIAHHVLLEIREYLDQPPPGIFDRDASTLDESHLPHGDALVPALGDRQPITRPTAAEPRATGLLMSMSQCTRWPSQASKNCAFNP